jgi:ribose 5-phosphate isomerase B
MKIAVGSDHRGYEAKEKIKEVLKRLGHEVVDEGTHSRESTDYPDAAFVTAKAIVDKQAEYGVLICGTGIGMSIAANKVPGIRAALCHDELTAKMAREHNNANILCLPGDLIGEHLAQRVVEAWLKAEFAGGRHSRRLQKIADYENHRDVKPGP